MITPAQRAEIRRLFYGEHWKVGTIAAQLGLHHETVRAAVERETSGFRRGACRPSILDPYLPFIRDTLAQYPSLRATRVYEMVRQRGYAGSVIQVRRLVRRLRPETNRAVYRRVVTLAGESAQSTGLVRQGPHRTGHTHGLRVRHGPRLLARHRRAVHPRPDAGELPARARRRLRRAGRCRPQPRLRQPAQRRARPPRGGRPISSPPARARRPLPLRAPPLHTGTRK